MEAVLKVLKIYVLCLGGLGAVFVLVICGPVGIFVGVPLLLAVPAYGWLNQRERLDALEEQNRDLEKQVRELEEQIRALESAEDGKVGDE